MVTSVRTVRRRRKAASPGIVARYDYVSAKRGERLLDRQARRYLKMSGAEFKARYAAGTIPDPDRAEVIRVAMLLPFADD